ncbi:hypothetical protein ACFQ8C_33890 [Streptomyces sp. NPDC056503]|uniref:hypothetical protein n=1 Tax=Streptomyces sp. NPDC056503 TaxID=3345842 RepID=UPI0036B926E6
MSVTSAPVCRPAESLDVTALAVLTALTRRTVLVSLSALSALSVPSALTGRTVRPVLARPRPPGRAACGTVRWPLD